MASAGVLPSSGRHVELREPTGEDELLVLQSMGPAPTTVLALASRLASGQSEPIDAEGELIDAQGGSIDWPALPAVDLGGAALLIRRCWLGETIRAEALCPAEGCGDAIDVAIDIQAYLDHHRPRPYRGAKEYEPGWFVLAGTDVRFRIPRIADVLEILNDPRPGARLLERCIRSPGHSDAAQLPTSVARRVDRALEALAPRLDGELSGVCPACGQTVALHFEPVGYVLAELRDASTGLFSQVHELALAYHWSEQTILALDRRRRHGYVTMIRGELALA